MSPTPKPPHWWNRWSESEKPASPLEPSEASPQEVVVPPDHPLPVAARWWGSHAVPEGGHLHLRIGPLDLTAQRNPHEWRIAWNRDDTFEDGVAKAELAVVDHGSETEANLERFVFSHTPKRLTLRPRLADRPVVSRPITPLHIPAGEQVVVFISSPLWVAFEVGEEGRLLKDLPIVRPSDTWFGPSTLEGEVCYAGRTRATLALEPPPHPPERATIPTLVRNESRQEMLLERINLPVPLLSLFADQQGRLWSEGLTLVREGDGDMASLHIGKGPPQHAGQAERVAPPRHEAGHRILARAFSALFG